MDRYSIMAIPAKLLVLVLLTLGVLIQYATAQTPGVLWTTNVGARLFAVDTQTNVFANSGGTVLILNGDGELLQSSLICPRPGLAQRDNDGNYYFAGVMPNHLGFSGIWLDFDPQDFGGVILSNQAAYLAKYSSAGNLLWAVSFGPGDENVRSVKVTDCLLDDGGNIYVGYSYNSGTLVHSSALSKFDSQGLNQWSVGVPQSSGFSTTHGNVRVGAISATNGFALEYSNPTSHPWQVALSSVNKSDGGMSIVSNWWLDDGNLPFASVAARPAFNSLGEIYNVENGALTKRSATGFSVIWSKNINGWTLGRDVWDGVHLSDSTGAFFRCDIDGNLVWSTNLPSPCNAMVLDSSGNQFISLFNGTVARIGIAKAPSPTIITDPRWLPEGFRFTLVGDPLSTYEIFGSTNLNSWTSLGIVTNIFGEIQFMDTNAQNFQQRFYKSVP